MRRWLSYRWLLSLSRLSAVSAVVGLIATPAASAQQSLNLYLGGFVPTSADARGTTTNGVSSDVLVQDQNFLAFNINRFNAATVGGEWLVALGDKFDAGLGLGFYQRTVPAVDANFVNANGSEVVSNLKLRIVPFTATIRVLPFGHDAPLQPYVGAGVGVFVWRYSESGQFVDPTDQSIFSGTFVGSGSKTGPVVLGGVRAPIGSTAVGFELRYQKANATLPGNQGFAGTTIDLGGMNYLFTFNIRF
jgi:hypothetical protein